MSDDPNPLHSSSDLEECLMVAPIFQYASPGYEVRDYESPRNRFQDAATPRSIHTPVQRLGTTKDLMLGTPGRQTHMNTQLVSGPYPMSGVVYGYRPESGWTGVLFQVFLQGPIVQNWQKLKEVEYWITFEGQEVKAVFYELDSQVLLPDIGTKRYVLQCIIPQANTEMGRVPVTLSVHGLGGKSVVQSLFMGYFHYKPDDGTLKTYEYHGNTVAMLQWLEGNLPQDIHELTPINRAELCDGSSDQMIVIAMKEEPFQPQPYSQYSDFSQVPTDFGQYQRDMQGRMWQLQDNRDAVEEYKTSPYNEELYHQYYPSQESLQGVPTMNFTYSIPERAQNASRPELSSSPFEMKFEPNLSVSQGPLIQSPSPRRHLSPPTHPYRGQGYGKINFLHRPDQLGDINQWTYQERQDSRRIVCFTKITRGDVIQLDCFPIPSHEYKGMTTISCIRWIPSPPGEIQHKYSGKCVFTSVDIILLIEKLVGYGFQVQEKNRIRRNLEGFHPETVKKEGGTHRFFNQVMSYAQPKTRNIEKDIKVFLWSDITKSLRKIVQKYHNKGRIPLGRPISEPTISSVPFAVLSSQPSSSESLPTQRSFSDQYSQLTQPEMQPPFLNQEFGYPLQQGTQMYFPEDAGDSSSSSISPMSQISQLSVPHVNMRIPVDYSQVVGGNNEQEFQGYPQNVPGEFDLDNL